MTDIHIIRKDDRGFPALLGKITDPPDQLYCRGDISLLDSFCISVVGTRNTSDYGRQVCADIAGNLAAAGITIVSGLAIGIDAIAHQSALEAINGKTIAVLGTGIEHLWPRENERLGKRIIDQGGLVISEYPGITPGAKYTFPMRNRIISGLSRGTVIIEADKKSGSIITARSALDQDRDVFAVPGSIYWPRSVGTNWLIQEGAKLIMNAQDVLDSYRLAQVPLPSDAIGLSTQDPVQEKILAILKSDGPTHMDELASRCECEPSRVMAAIALLELKSRITHQGNGIYLCIPLEVNKR